MRFFSNEAKDNVEDQDQDVRTDAVPQQRPGSPWDERPGANAEHDQATVAGAYGTDPASDTPRTGDDVNEDDEARARANDDTIAWGSDETPANRDHDADPDVDVPLDDHTDAADRDADRRDDLDSNTPDGTALDRDDSLDRDAALDRSDADRSDADRSDADRSDADRSDADRDDLDRDGDGVTDEQHVAVHRAADDTDDDLSESDNGRVGDTVVGEAVEDRGTFEDPQVVDEDKDADESSTVDAVEPVAVEPVVAEPVVEPVVAEPVAVVDPEPVVAVAAVPEPVAATPTGPAALFPDSETQPLRDRWRDIQLRFVDDPKATTAEAATLVDETIEKLTASLREHRGSLSGGGDDTEALRVELRSYRDILDRLLGL